MARPKSYDRDAALSRACDAFWQHGYTALGVRAIEEKTGLNQFAIRTEFGGKEGLYHEALEYYADQAEKYLLAPMKDGGVAGVGRFFESLVSPGAPGASMWGCLVVNTGVENASFVNPGIARLTGKYWSILDAHFLKALQYSSANGALIPGLDIAEASKSLVVAVMGIHTMNRISGSPSAGAPMVKTVLGLINDWRR